MRTVLAAAMVCVLAGCGGGSAGGAAGAAAGGAPAKPLTVVNGDFEQGGDESGIPGWNQGQHAGPKSYEMAVDHDAPYAGSGSFRITRTREQFYGTISQNVDLDGKGGDLELAAMIKTKDVGPQGWKLMITGKGVREFSPPQTGTSDWHRVSVRASVPPGTKTIEIGATLLDGGSAWLDNVTLEAIAR